MSCHHVPGGLQDLLDEAWGPRPTTLRELPVLPAPREHGPLEQPAVSPFQFSKKVEEAMEEYVRPFLRKDGGDLELLDIKGTLLYIRLKGACSGCASSGQTMKLMVEKTLKEMVDERIRVVAV
jgi:NifU-like protein